MEALRRSGAQALRRSGVQALKRQALHPQQAKPPWATVRRDSGDRFRCPGCRRQADGLAYRRPHVAAELLSCRLMNLFRKATKQFFQIQISLSNLIS
jgi:hypothetical protein